MREEPQTETETPGAHRGLRHRLRTPGPLGLLDQAFALVRAGDRGLLVPALLGGLLLGAAGLCTYALEAVEGVRSLRLLLAALWVLAWGSRAVLLGKATRRALRRLAPELGAEPGAGHLLDTLRTACVLGFGLWIGLWPLAAGALLGPLGVCLMVPLLALRGGLAPSWLARLRMHREGGFKAVFRASTDSSGRRVAGVLTELLLLLGGLGLLANLYAASAAGVVLLRTYFGLELSVLESFLSLQNAFLWVLAGALTVTLLEPLRAALSAVIYVDALSRHQGLDLKRALDQIHGVQGPQRPRITERGGSSEAALVLIGLGLCGASVLGAATASPAHAQPPPPPVQQAHQGDSSSEAAASLREDDRVRTEVSRILSREEFREFEEGRGRGTRALLRRLMRWLGGLFEEPPEILPLDLRALPLPGISVFLGFGVLLLIGVGGFVLWSLLHRRRERRDGPTQREAEEEAHPLERAPTEHLREAAGLKGEGQLRAALRALYLATLTALDRRGRIAFDPTKTNRQYLRSMPAGEDRERFGSLTRIFDRTHYGKSPVSEQEYRRCRGLAEAIVAEEGR